MVIYLKENNMITNRWLHNTIFYLKVNMIDYGRVHNTINKYKGEQYDYQWKGIQYK